LTSLISNRKSRHSGNNLSNNKIEASSEDICKQA
jgi:hypothetical protein